MRIATKLALGLGAAALTPVLVLTGSAIYGEVNEPHIQPSVVRIDSAADCEKADFYAVYASGTGLQTAKYAARNSQDLAKRYNACRLVVDYGTNYNAGHIAEQLVGSVRDSKGVGHDGNAHLMMVGASFGGIAVQEVANSLAEGDIKDIQVNRLVLESTPSSNADVSTSLQVAFFANKSPIIAGPLPVWVSGVWGAIKHGDSLLDPKTLEYINGNTSETSTRLMRQQIQKIEQGYPEQKQPTHVSLMSSKGDIVVDYETAKNSLRAKIGESLFKHYDIITVHSPADTNHAESWLDYKWYRYAAAYEEEYRRMSLSYKKVASGPKPIKEPA